MQLVMECLLPKVLPVLCIITVLRAQLHPFHATMVSLLWQMGLKMCRTALSAQEVTIANWEISLKTISLRRVILLLSYKTLSFMESAKQAMFVKKDQL
jgi:hypothetical protein